MTAETQNSFRPPYDFSTDPDRITLDDVRARDTYLDTLLDMVLGPISVRDNKDAALSLTVTVGGVTVSGMAISPEAWVEKTQDELASNSELAQAFGTFHDNLSAAVQERRELRDKEKRPQPARRFLHMKDVTIAANAGNGPLELRLWRGQMQDISSWSLGALNFD